MLTCWWLLSVVWRPWSSLELSVLSDAFTLTPVTMNGLIWNHFCFVFITGIGNFSKRVLPQHLVIFRCTIALKLGQITHNFAILYIDDFILVSALLFMFCLFQQRCLSDRTSLSLLEPDTNGFTYRWHSSTCLWVSYVAFLSDMQDRNPSLDAQPTTDAEPTRKTRRQYHGLIGSPVYHPAHPLWV